MGEDESEIEKRNTLAVWASIAADAKDEGDIKRIFLAAAKPQVGGREVEVADGVDDLFKEASAAHYMPPRFLASLFLPLSPSLSRPPPMHLQLQKLLQLVRTEIKEQGGDPDALVHVEGSGCGIDKVESLMHDNCNAANAAARAITNKIVESRKALSPADLVGQLKEEVVDGNCMNHGRVTVVTAYARRSCATLQENLGEDAEKYSAVQRLELELNSVVYSVCKAIRWTGTAQYAKGRQQQFLAFVRENYPDLTGAHSLGRGECGSRFDMLTSVASNMWVYIPAITEFLFPCAIHGQDLRPWAQKQNAPHPPLTHQNTNVPKKMDFCRAPGDPRRHVPGVAHPSRITQHHRLSPQVEWLSQTVDRKTSMPPLNT